MKPIPAESRALSRLLLMFLLMLPGPLISLQANDLSEYIDMALEESVELKRQSMDLLTAGEAVRQSWSLLLPSMGLNLSSSYRQYGIPETVSNSISASLSLQLNADVANAMKRKDLALEQSRLSRESVRGSIIRETTDAFYGLLLARGEGELLEEDLALAKKQLTRSRVKFESGLVNERTLLQAQLAVEQARLAMEKQHSSLQLQERSFRQLVGLEEGADLLLDGKIESVPVELDLEWLLENYLAARTDIRSAEVGLRQDKVEKSSAAWSRAPSLSLGAGLSNLESIPDQRMTASVSLSIPLDGWIPGSQKDQKLRSAAREYAKSELSLREQRKAAEMEIRNLAAALEQAERSMEISAMQVSIAERLYQLAEEGFTRGTVERLELEEARGDLLSSRLEELNGTYTHLQALLKLKQALNIDSTSDIPRSN